VRAVAYIRVSDPSQVEGHSLVARERLFLELCKSRGWEAIKVYREEGVTAHSDAIAKRPQFRLVLDDAANGQFDVVVVHTLDRWARNLRVQLEGMAVLSRNGIGFVSITENINYSTAQGRLQAQILRSFAEYFSESLAGHIRKGQDQRADEGRHTGGIPFGYTSCKDEQGRPQCDPEHPGGVHQIPDEAEAVKQLFQKYARGTTTTVQLASWLNDQGFRTRNMHRFNGEDAKPRMFTSASVRGILYNPFFAGNIRHREKIMPGAHEGLISPELFDQAQAIMKRNSGRTRAFHIKPQREYLLKGLIRCAYCGLPMWAQTYNSGSSYYREQRGSRGAGACINQGGSIPGHKADEQMGRILEAIQLPDAWLDAELSKINLQDEAKRVGERRMQVAERLKRLGRAYVDGMVNEEDYSREKQYLKMELEILVVPGAEAAEKAGRLVEHLPELWREADLTERHRLLVTMLDGVYVDARETHSIVMIRPKAPFRAVFWTAVTREWSGVELIRYEPQGNSPRAHTDPCSWWRRGRVELPVQRTSRWNVLQACPVFISRSQGPYWPGSLGSQPMLLMSSLSA